MKKATEKTELLCSNCGAIFPIMRKGYKLKPLQHIKDMYCYKCNKTTKFIELHDSDLLKAKLKRKDRTKYEQFIYELLCRNDEVQDLCQTKSI